MYYVHKINQKFKYILKWFDLDRYPVKFQDSVQLKKIKKQYLIYIQSKK